MISLHNRSMSCWSRIQISLPHKLPRSIPTESSDAKNLGALSIQMDSRAYPSSDFVVANTLAKWKKLEPNEINFSQGFSQKVVSRSCFVFNTLPAMSADNLCKQFGPRSGPTKCRAWSGSKLFDTRMVLKKSSIQRVKYGTIIKCEGIIKAVFENPKADQNTLFCKYVIFEPLRLYF